MERQTKRDKYRPFEVVVENRPPRQQKRYHPLPLNPYMTSPITVPRARCSLGSEYIGLAPNIKVSRADEDKASIPGIKRVGKRDNPEKTLRPAALSGMIPTCENLEASQPGIEPGSPRMETSSLTTTPPRPHDFVDISIATRHTSINHARDTPFRDFVRPKSGQARQGGGAGKYEEVKGLGMQPVAESLKRSLISSRRRRRAGLWFLAQHQQPTSAHWQLRWFFFLSNLAAWLLSDGGEGRRPQCEENCNELEERRHTTRVQRQKAAKCIEVTFGSRLCEATGRWSSEEVQ
ncbi:hypothetical protein PR048_031030 [Dryococelus australis]|uniref:Uncharacterized protein n=1 Tax=Dryococelus australis TaxID=614101 RepID=A0ABQ9G434_9NEOP|nr:hypothetical protein PR048_031030 [Dryococelus australis]